jgi:hypothetical protein
MGNISQLSPWLSPGVYMQSSARMPEIPDRSHGDTMGQVPADLWKFVCVYMQEPWITRVNIR